MRSAFTVHVRQRFKLFARRLSEDLSGMEEAMNEWAERQAPEGSRIHRVQLAAFPLVLAAGRADGVLVALVNYEIPPGGS